MVSQIFSIVGIVGGYFAAVHYYVPLAAHLTFVDVGVAKILSFILIILVCIIAAVVIASLVGKVFRLPGLGLLNGFGGGAVGFVKGFLIVALMVIFLLAILPHDSPLLNKSSTLPFVLQGIKIVDNMVPQDLKNQYHKKIENLKNQVLKEELERKK